MLAVSRHVCGSEANVLVSNPWRLLSLKVHTLLDPQLMAPFLRESLPMCQMACMLNFLRTCEVLADRNTYSFFRMTSTKEAGGVLINYSDRFSISGLTGDTALRIKQAARALNGDTDGPPAEGNDVSSTTSSSMATPSETASSTSSGTLTSSTATGTSATSDPPSTEPSATDPAGSIDLLDVDDSSSGLSKGAIAGIATTVTAIVIGACAALMSFFYIRHRKKQNEVEEIASGSGINQKPMSELSAEELLAPKTFWTHTTELSSESMVHEAGSGERPPELDHMAFRAELEGSQPPTPK
jgi:hypothetical protein